jgi:hypothetical protein
MNLCEQLKATKCTKIVSFGLMTLVKKVSHDY